MNVYFAALLFLFALPLSTQAAIVSLKFSTEPQTISLGEPSGKMTVQLVNEAGVAEAPGVSGTHLKLETNSSTGSFSSSNTAWEPVTSLTVNSNWTSRSFYYKDTNEGTFTITVSPAESQSWTSASQQIQIGGSGNTGGTATSTEEEEIPSSSSSGNSNGYSSHSAQSDLTEAEETTIKIGAGRKRLATIGNPIEWHVEGKEIPRGMTFLWTLGDGTEEKGMTISHTYLYPGEYEVVLHGFSGEREVVSRTSVRIVEPRLFINQVVNSEYIELENKSGSEINLAGWYLGCDEKSFAFPRDTIIKSSMRIKFPLAIISCDMAETWSLYSGKELAATYDLKTIKSIEMEKIKKQIDDISGKISELQRKKFVITETIKQASALKEPQLIATSQAAQVIMLSKPKSSKSVWTFLNSLFK